MPHHVLARALTICTFHMAQFDGLKFRWMTSGEYIQMSGRAGRRGLDENGIVISMIDERLDSEACRSIVQGMPDPLISRFRLSYNMILNLMRVETMDAEFVIRRSFHQFQYERSLPDLEQQIKAAEAEYQTLSIPDPAAADQYFELVRLRDQLQAEALPHVQQPHVLLPFMQPGRVVHLRDDEQEYGWGIVINFRKRYQPNGFVLDVLLPAPTVETYRSVRFPKPDASYLLNAGPQDRAPIDVVAFALACVDQVSSIRVYLPPDLMESAIRRQVYQHLMALRRDIEFPLLDPVMDMGLHDPAVVQVLQRVRSLEHRMALSPIAKLSAPQRAALAEQYARKRAIDERLAALRRRSKESQVVQFQEELKTRLRVLRRLGHVDEQGLILPKGRVACEIESVDEVMQFS